MGGRGQIWLSRGLAILVVRGVWTPPRPPPRPPMGGGVLGSRRAKSNVQLSYGCTNGLTVETSIETVYVCSLVIVTSSDHSKNINAFPK